MVNKRLWNAVLGCNLKNERMIFVRFQGKPFNITESKSMPQPVTLKKLKLNGSMKTYKSFRTNTQKRCPFHYRGLECRSRKSRNTWSNRQIWPWNTEWSRAKPKEFCQENILVISNTLFQQHKRLLYTWTSPDVSISIRFIIFFAAKNGQSL